MEFLDKIQFSDYINIPYLLVFMFLSYLIKVQFKADLEKVTGITWRTVYIVLIIASVTAVPFVVLLYIPWNVIAVTYAIGTSLHELIFQWIENKFKSKIDG